MRQQMNMVKEEHLPHRFTAGMTSELKRRTVQENLTFEQAAETTIRQATQYRRDCVQKFTNHETKIINTEETMAPFIPAGDGVQVCFWLMYLGEPQGSYSH
jgi:hypothetical protein